VCTAPYTCPTYIDRTSDGPTVTVPFSSLFGTPACIRISSSQTLAISSVSGFHPLAQACGPTTVQSTTTTSMQMYQLSVGQYGFYCTNHNGGPNGSGMYLSVLVQ